MVDAEVIVIAPPSACPATHLCNFQLLALQLFLLRHLIATLCRSITPHCYSIHDLEVLQVLIIGLQLRSQLLRTAQTNGRQFHVDQ